MTEETYIPKEEGAEKPVSPSEIKDQDNKTPEDDVEKIEPLLEEVWKLEDDINEQRDEFLYAEGALDAPDVSLLKMQELMDMLEKESTAFLKKASRRLAEYPQLVADSFRDK